MNRLGRLEIITGPMFSGKSEELIRRLTRARIARQDVRCYKPSSDDRYHKTSVASHSQQTLEAIPVDDVIQLWEHIYLPVNRLVPVVGIDEAQFFDDKLVDVCLALVERGARVIVAGLDTDFRGEPFRPIPDLMAVADEVIKLTAVCMICGESANHTYRIDQGNQNLVSVGALGAYQARCRDCFRSTDELQLSFMFSQEIGNDKVCPGTIRTSRA